MFDDSGKCMDCEHSIFCRSLGEYKCTQYNKRIYFPTVRRSCYVSKKSTEEKECHCRVCEGRGDTE